MANLKISELSAASALGGTEVGAGVQAAGNVKITADQLKTYCRELKMVLAVPRIHQSTRYCGRNNHIVRTAAGVWYLFFVLETGQDLYYMKSSDSGVTWGLPVMVKTGTLGGVAVWFDKWTPGDSGTLIHVAYFDSAVVLYRSLDTSGDTLGTERTVFTGASATQAQNTCLAITKSRANRIYVAFDIDAGTETGFYKSDDFPVTAFTIKDNGIHEGVTDWYSLFPGNYADSADIDCVFNDRSALGLSLKTFDDSANNWTGVSAETAIIADGGFADISGNTVASQFSGAVRDSDGHLFVAAWSNADTLNADLRFFDINGAASITERTNVVLNSVDDQAVCAVSIDASGDHNVYYFGKSDGSETYATAMKMYYKRSTDDGVNWGAETEVGTGNIARGLSFIAAAKEIGDGEHVVGQYADDWPPTGGGALSVMVATLT